MKRARQREFGFTNWGGKRGGAGRKPKGERAGVSHAKRPKLCARHPVLVTLRLRAGLPSLRYNDTHAVVKAALASRSQSEKFRIIEYSLQSNHLHMVAESDSAHALSRGMIGLAVRIARGLNRLWKRAGDVFLDRYHSRILQTPRAVRIALIYVLQNARKHGAWRTAMPDVFSSAPSFEGWKSGRTKLAESRPRFLERARTWLLSIGWRRHGLISLHESPSSASAA